MGHSPPQVTVIFLANEFMDYLCAIPHPIVPDWRFHPDNLGTYKAQGLHARDLFRFTTDQLYELCDELRLPFVMYTSARDRFYALEGLCIVLRRLVFPIRWKDVICLFGRSKSPLSRIHKYGLYMLYASLGYTNLHAYMHARTNK